MSVLARRKQNARMMRIPFRRRVKHARAWNRVARLLCRLLELAYRAPDESDLA